MKTRRDIEIRIMALITVRNESTSEIEKDGYNEQIKALFWVLDDE